MVGVIYLGVGVFVNQVGVERIVVGGVKGLVEFSTSEVVLATRKGTVRVFGEDLEILYFDTDEIALKGRICGYEC